MYYVYVELPIVLLRQKQLQINAAMSVPTFLNIISPLFVSNSDKA